MKSEPIYLKIEPGTYNLRRDQMYQFDVCQFCGSNHQIYTKLYGTSGTKRERTREWIRRCKDCKRTTALIYKNGHLPK